MKITDFDYDLPIELIANYPLEKRDECRLMVLDRERKTFENKIFRDILDYFQPGNVLVLNNAKVIPARFFGRKETGAELEIFLLRNVENNFWEATAENSAKWKIGQIVEISPEFRMKLIEKTYDKEGGLVIELIGENVSELIKEYGHVPLPKYIERDDEKSDLEDYQTVFAEKEGAVAAPTAGLHFTESLLEKIKQKGVEICFVTLHVGIGTFAPVKVDEVESHKMHEEFYEIPDSTVKKIRDAKNLGKKIFSVGTTVTRALETFAKTGEQSGFSDIFIYPPFEFKIVDALITNFHLPKSTLILMISAFGGKDFIFDAYREAIQGKYRFYSYGDAMLIK